MMNTNNSNSGTIVDVDNEHFKAWSTYWGELATVDDECGRSRIFGFETVSQDGKVEDEVADDGACFGFCVGGRVGIEDAFGKLEIGPGQWFSTPAGLRITFDEPAQVVVSQRLEWHGMRALGGPIEELGRLRYIDGCSDTILAMPPVLGDPCLNHLHFPTGIEQTEHWHPSIRAGMVARGEGLCETPYGMSQLVSGLIFMIPTRGLHRFITTSQHLDVIAYHPDSDWGPTDTDHPMVNRTWIEEGQKIDNSSGIHATAEIADRWKLAVQSY